MSSKKKQQRPKYISRFVYWTPRILSIIFLLFLALFSLDIFDSCAGFWDCALGLFMHNLPVLVLAVFLVIAWKHEIVGAVGFFLFVIIYIGFIVRNIVMGEGEWFMIMWVVQIAGPALFVGILFLMCWLKKRKHKGK